MHIEPGVVHGAKIALSYVTASGAFGFAGKMAFGAIKNESGVAWLAARTVATTALVFGFFEVFPHYRIGVSEVHLILGSTLFLIFGGGAAALGLAFGLLAQGLLFASADLPQYGINVTTLLVPLYIMSLLARKIIPNKTAYKDIRYSQALALSTCYQSGIVAWVAFWAFYGQGFGAENLAQIGSFGAAYMTVIIVEPLVDLAVLAVVKNLDRFRDSQMFHGRLFSPAS